MIMVRPIMMAAPQSCHKLTIIISGATILLIVCFALGQASAAAGEQPTQAPLSRLKRSTTSNLIEKYLLDWDSYRNLFKKKYSSLQQELARQRIFLARLIDVFKTSCKYMMNMVNYWTSINKFSDWTNHEVKRILRGDQSDLERFQFTDEETAFQILNANLNKEIEQGTRVLPRKRRSSIQTPLESDQKQTRKILSPDDLIKIDHEPKENETLSNVEMIPPLSNPEYVPVLQVETPIPKSPLVPDIPISEINEGVSKFEEYYSRSVDYVKFGYMKLKEYASKIDPISILTSDPPAEVTPPPAALDSMLATVPNTYYIKDWRDSRCIGPVRNQEVCNCCYAMSATSYMEWALCMNQGRVFTPLSVQYAVSCGPQFAQESDNKYFLYGCYLGMSSHITEFFREYGVELEANMPYLDYETSCPIPPFSSKKQKGYIRPNLNDPVRLAPTTNRLDLALELGPVVVRMVTSENFLQYGGGILDHCDTTDDTRHSMLIVGRAVEEGVEYLIIKNSFGTGWGHNGYLKFDRAAIQGCVREFIAPSVNFPSGKSLARHAKAYMARQDIKGEAFDGVEAGDMDKLYENEFD